MHRFLALPGRCRLEEPVAWLVVERVAGLAPGVAKARALVAATARAEPASPVVEPARGLPGAAKPEPVLPDGVRPEPDAVRAEARAVDKVLAVKVLAASAADRALAVKVPVASAAASGQVVLPVAGDWARRRAPLPGAATGLAYRWPARRQQASSQPVSEPRPQARPAVVVLPR